MICKNCGAQIADDTRFCNSCGTPVAAETPKTDDKTESTKKNVQTLSINSVNLNRFNPFRPGNDVINSSVILGTVFLHFMLFLFWFIPTISLTPDAFANMDGASSIYLHYVGKLSESDVLTSLTTPSISLGSAYIFGMFFTVATVIIDLIVMQMLIRPILKGKYTRSYRIPFIVSVSWHTVMYFISMIYASASGFDIGVSVGGIFFLIFMVLSIALIVLNILYQKGIIKIGTSSN